MKSFLPLGLLLAFAVHVSVGAPIQKRDDTEAWKHQLLGIMNAVRKMMEITLHQRGDYTNFPQMVYDKSLQSAADAFSSDCRDWRHSSSYRYARMSPPLTDFIMKKMTEQGEEAFIRQIKNMDKEEENLFLIEFLNPTARRVVCVQKYCKTRSPAWMGFPEPEVVTDFLCLVGK